MSLITAKKLFERSFQQNFSLAAFNVFNVESLQAVVEACEHEKSPAIIQILMVTLKCLMIKKN